MELLHHSVTKYKASQELAQYILETCAASTSQHLQNRLTNKTCNDKVLTNLRITKGEIKWSSTATSPQNKTKTKQKNK